MNVSPETYIEHYNAIAEKESGWLQEGENNQTQYKQLCQEFLALARKNWGKAEDIHERLLTIKENDTARNQIGRFFRALFWGALGGIGVITVVPAVAYGITALIQQKDPLQWSHKLSLKSEEQLKVEKEWDDLRKVSILPSPYDVPCVPSNRFDVLETNALALNRFNLAGVERVFRLSASELAKKKEL